MVNSELQRYKTLVSVYDTLMKRYLKLHEDAEKRVVEWGKELPIEPGLYLYKSDKQLHERGACLLDVQYCKPEAPCIANDLLKRRIGPAYSAAQLCVGRNPIDEEESGWWYGPIPRPGANQAREADCR